MLSEVDLINNIEINNENQKLIIVDDSNNWMKNVCKRFNLLIISENKTNPIFKLKEDKEPKIIYDIKKISEIRIINDENILIYKMSNVLFYEFHLFYHIKFNSNVILHFPNIGNIFMYFVNLSNDESLFGQFYSYDKRNFLKILFSKKIKYQNGSCPICYENFNEDNIIKTNCSHLFCKQCITKLVNLKCPMCRQEITKLYPCKFQTNIINEMKNKISNLNKEILIITEDLRIKKFFNNDKITFRKYKYKWMNNINDKSIIFFFINSTRIMIQLATELRLGNKNLKNKTFYLFA